MKNGIILIITKSLIQNGVILSHSVLVLLRVIKFVMLASYELVTDIIAKNNIAVMPENVNGLFINMKYQEGHVDIITGTSLNVFTLDKQLDTAFDKYVKTFLANAGLDFEEL